MRGAAATCLPPPWVLVPIPNNSSPIGTSGHFHMELLLQGVGTNWRPGPRLSAISPRAEVCGEGGPVLTHLGLLDPHGPRSLGLFIEAPYHPGAHTWSLMPALLLWAKSSLSPSSAHKAGSGSDLQLPGRLCPTPDTPTLCPQVPCFLLSLPTRAGPQFQVGPQWLLPFALCPPFLPWPQGRGTVRESWTSVGLQGSLTVQIPEDGSR